MAPKNLIQNHVGEEERAEEGNDSDSDSEAAEEEVATPLVPPKKPKFTSPQKLLLSESVENGSACSSPSASGFVIVPSQKPFVEKNMKKKAPASKVFSNEDVIALLKGLAVFWANGRNNKWTEFHLFIKDDLRNQFTKIQVSEKIRSLKKKFDTNLERARTNGARLELLDPHESAVFELSKKLWGEDERVFASEKQISENGDEEANEIRTEKKKVVENDEGSKRIKKRKKVDENGDGGKNMRKQKQFGVCSEENKKSGKPENGIDELLEEGYEGDEHEAANTILSICKLVERHGEGEKKKRKKKHVDELDEKNELVNEGVQVDKHDAANKQKHVDKRSEGKKKKRKHKKVDEHVEKNEILKEVHQVDEHDEKEELLKEGEQVDEHEEQDEPTSEQKQVNGHGKKKKIVKKGKQVDHHSKENNVSANKEQEVEIRAEDFHSAYPLLYASFDTFKYPKSAKENCFLIGRENAVELEEKWRELNAEMHHIELKKLDLMKKNSKDGLQRK